MKAFNFHIPTKIIFGPKKIQLLNSETNSSLKNILIVTDPDISTNTKIIEICSKQLKGKNISIFSEIEANPSFETVEKGGNLARENSIDLVIGIGGGSSMDAAKGIAILATNSGSLRSIINSSELLNNPLPIICIPTTSGTGSEVTPFAVFTDNEKHTKVGYAHDKIFPGVSIIDPELSYSMPPSVIINTGFDVLAHSVEAFLSTESFDLNDNLALQAIQIVIDNLDKASKKEKEAMNRMAYASMLGGIVIAHASTILPHIMGYPLTTFHNVPHGIASVIILPAFLNYLRKNKLQSEKVKKLDSMFENSGGTEKFINHLGVSTRLKDYGVKEDELEEYVQKTIVKGDVKITPGTIDSEILFSIFKDAL